MLNRVLMEVADNVECPPNKLPKGPKEKPSVTQANPVEIKRVIAALITRRKNLDAAHAKF